jgi:hypothetical protein
MCRFLIDILISGSLGFTTMHQGSFANFFMKTKWSPLTHFFIVVIPLNLWYVINLFYTLGAHHG